MLHLMTPSLTSVQTLSSSAIQRPQFIRIVLVMDVSSSMRGVSTH